jgi:hypothetical protein
MITFPYTTPYSRQRGFLIFWAIAICLLGSIGSYAQTIRYVKPNSSGSGDGSSWANATNDLQTAINSLSATGGQVWMTSGLYKPTVPAGFNGFDSRFTLTDGIAIYGGFTGNETTLSDRIESHPASTTLSGNVGDPASRDDNSQYILYAFNMDSTAILDGLVITEGNTGLLAERTHLQINNCTFVANAGGILSYAGGAGNTNDQFANRIQITNSAFQANLNGISTNSEGGHGNYFTVINCLFEKNINPNQPIITSAFGGALTVNGAAMSLINCTFRNNYAYYGGVVSSTASHTVTMTNCILFGNSGSAGYENFFPDTPTIRYSLIDRPLPYQEPSVIVSTTSPFVSETSAQLNACSYAVDAGDPATTQTTVGSIDLAGNPRFVRTRIDLGAYEYQGGLCAPDIYTLQSGRWDDVAIWSAGRLPTDADRVLVKHAVTIPQNYQASVLKLIFDVSARLIYETGGRLSVNPLRR